MNPAYQIPLTDKDLALLGELTVILGQADDKMVELVAHFLKIDRPAANVVMGSSKIGDNASIWSEVIRNRCTDEDVLWLVEHALKEIQAVSEGRNDFIHAVFQTRHLPFAFGMGGFGMGAYGIRNRPDVLARRVRKQKQRPVKELQGVRDQAARLSCLIAHISDIAIGNPADKTPWHERLAPSLPPRLDTVAERKEKAQRGQPKPSRKKP